MDVNVTQHWALFWFSAHLTLTFLDPCMRFYASALAPNSLNQIKPASVPVSITETQTQNWDLEPVSAGTILEPLKSQIVSPLKYLYVKKVRLRAPYKEAPKMWRGSF